ncbi:chloride channel protein [Actinomadura bangladeshensis]|uniref:chloride channel protein n=1 Tax=Actinomadura bangladeshensis TaxID=453573 RepID=UPI001FB73FC2|nr:chloride channel protein [Actinomadura bangladeshensis]
MGGASPDAVIPVERRARGIMARVRETQWGLILLALVAGCGAGAGAVVFRELIRLFTHLFTGHADYSAAGHAANPHLAWAGPFFVLAVPVVAGLVYGPLVHRFAPEARGHGVPEVMLAVAQRGGRIGAQVALVKSLASALTIGSGGSVGREGPIVQIGAALGSTLGRVVRLTEARLRILVACGAAGGIAATFNAPLAGVFFAMELILRDFTVESFGVVVLASVTASVIGRAAFGSGSFMQLPDFHMDHPAEYALFAVLGLAGALVGVGFTRVLYTVEDACDRIWRGPEWLRPAAGGLLLGGLLLAVPQMYGVGYPALEKAVDGGYAIGFLLLLLGAKILATSLTIGIGGSGGVFAPSLFMGAMLGSAFGAGVHQVAPSLTSSPGAYGLVGMGAVFAGAARAPITAVVILFELTGEYSIILPMMTAIVVAALASRHLSAGTVYTVKLRRRGIDLDAPPTDPRLTRRVASVMEPVPAPLSGALSVAAAAQPLVLSEHGALPVLDEQGAYQGVITARAAAEALADAEAGRQTVPPSAGDLAEMPAPLTIDMPLSDALHVLTAAGGSGLPVLDAERTVLAGWITHQSVLRALHVPAEGGQGADPVASKGVLRFVVDGSGRREREDAR